MTHVRKNCRQSSLSVKLKDTVTISEDLDKQRVRKYKEQSEKGKRKKGKCHLINIAIDHVSHFHRFL